MEKIAAYRTNYGAIFANEVEAIEAENNNAYEVEAKALADREGVYAEGKKTILVFLMENKSSIKHLGSLV